MICATTVWSAIGEFSTGGLLVADEEINVGEGAGADGLFGADQGTPAGDAVGADRLFGADNGISMGDAVGADRLFGADNGISMGEAVGADGGFVADGTIGSDGVLCVCGATACVSSSITCAMAFASSAGGAATGDCVNCTTSSWTWTMA